MTKASSRLARRASPIDLATVADRQYKDDDLFLEYVVDDAVVADANAHLATASLELDAARRAWVSSKPIDRLDDALCDATVELAQRFER
jgi:hypothetical protein